MSSGTRGTATSCFHTIGARWRSSGFLVRMATPINIPRKVNSSRSDSLEAAGFNRNLCTHDQTSINCFPYSLTNPYLLHKLFLLHLLFFFIVSMKQIITVHERQQNVSTVAVYKENRASVIAISF